MVIGIDLTYNFFTDYLSYALINNNGKLKRMLNTLSKQVKGKALNHKKIYW
ncbi:hypothetical protein BB561_000312 [Smittium simulii]|uniref:Uncharacterized protein n=1 Tax=Smittium simulii TaxID=133385 RepID=A0A2T9YZM0_9FUNG|nr:hypothetical protein BB561_000324 [Smittium simulii]PVU97788.1 hypothetical protein BB561_000312 [Smittium simulii]